MNTIQPTIGRIVLVTATNQDGKPVTLPAIVTHVHSMDCVSVVALSALTDISSLMPGGTLPLPSLSYNVDGAKVGTWCWMEYQKGQAARTDQTVSQVYRAMQEQVTAVELGLGKQLLDAVTAATSPLVDKIADLQAQIAALNFKQPASQRLPVEDSTPVVVVPAIGEAIGSNSP